MKAEITLSSGDTFNVLDIKSLHYLDKPKRREITRHIELILKDGRKFEFIGEDEIFAVLKLFDFAVELERSRILKEWGGAGS